MCRKSKTNQLVICSIFIFLILCLNNSCIFPNLSDECNNNLLKEINSPNKQYKAVVFQRNCGATTDFSTQVSILPINSVLSNDSGNVFICDSNHGKAPSNSGGPQVEVEWKESDLLQITTNRNVRIFLSQDKLDNISIAYVKKDF